MDLIHEDYNNVAGAMVSGTAAAWDHLETILRQMPLHVKASDQRGIQGRPIFDPVGTNQYIKTALQGLPHPGWLMNVAIPAEYDFLGTDVDFVNNTLLIEAQFSNYPFLLNNVIRSELFVKGKVLLSKVPINCVVIITKAHIFPASNSTLYYEQAVKQLRALAAVKVFDVPIRLVGLTATSGTIIDATWTKYSETRYSRTIDTQEEAKFRVVAPRNGRGRASLLKVN
jgi:hypothetical protein